MLLVCSSSRHIFKASGDQLIDVEFYGSGSFYTLLFQFNLIVNPLAVAVDIGIELF